MLRQNELLYVQLLQFVVLAKKRFIAAVVKR